MFLIKRQIDTHDGLYQTLNAYHPNIKLTIETNQNINQSRYGLNGIPKFQSNIREIP